AGECTSSCNIQEGFLRAYRGKGGNFVIKEFKAGLESGEVASKDVVVCADGLDSECRETLIGIQLQPAHIPGTDDGTLVPNAYGAKCILPAEFIPEHLELIQQQLTAGLQHYTLDELVPVALEHCQMTTFDIPLRHQPKDGFAKEHISPDTGKKQLRVVVGDVAVSAHYFTVDILSGGVDIGFHLAFTTVLSFDDYGGKKMKYAVVAAEINERADASYCMKGSVK
ncbi:hypothetical protein HK102_007950, partial [Quaeritorhiza haematococci]